MILIVCGLRLYSLLALVSNRRCCRSPIAMTTHASAITTMLVTTTFTPYFIQRSFCVSGSDEDVGGCSFILKRTRLLPSPRFQNFHGQKQKDSRGGDEENQISRIDHTLAEIGVSGEHALIGGAAPK